MYSILFSFGGFNIYSHGVMIILGAFFGAWLLKYLLSGKKVSSIFLLELVLVSFIGGIIGARLLYFILYFNQFSGFWDFFKLWQGGMVSFGGALGGILVAVWFLRKNKQNVLEWLDLAIAPLLLGWSIGRIGCFLNGDSFGVATLSKLSIWGYFPTPLWESIWLVVAAVICLIILKRKNKFVLASGIIFNLGLALYGFGRFFIDYFKAEPVWFLGLKYGQIGSAMVLALAIIMILVILYYHRYKTNK